MAQPRTEDGLLRLPAQVQARIVAYAAKVLQAHKFFSAMRNKMAAIDIAYARYKMAPSEESGNVPCDVFSSDSVTPPIVVSQVDSMVANWADVFLSGYPLFPVVSTYKTKQWAEQLEALLDDHASLGGYARQILLFLKDGGKYNFCAMEANWDQISQFAILDDYSNASGQKIAINAKSFTRITRLDPYNTVYDYNVNPGDVSAKGDYAGYLELLSKVKLKTLLNKYSQDRSVYNVAEAMQNDLQGSDNSYSMNYHMHPQVNQFVTPRTPLDLIDWDAYMTGTSPTKGVRPGQALNYEVFHLYARIIPSEMGLSAPQPNSPQIWKFTFVNSRILVHAKRVISANDCLPILIGQPQEDGLGYQTPGVAEAAMDFQESAGKLYNIRFASARRAVSDRALYDSDAIRPKDVNSRSAAAKIPFRTSSLVSGTKQLKDLYYPIPFDPRGTETVLQDAAMIAEFAKDLAGLNNAQRGQFQKGNKSVQEWSDVMDAAGGRSRMPIILLEFQVFAPLKFMLLLNIFQYGEDAVVVSQKTGELVEIDIAELRKRVLAFRLADGHTPKAKLAASETLTAGMNMIMNSPQLQQAFGSQLPAIFAHLMQLGGVRGLEEYAQPVQQLPPLSSELQGELQAPPAAPMAPQGTAAPQGMEQGIDPAMLQQMLQEAMPPS